MTEKLYNLDSHLFTFEAVVTDCREEKEGWVVELDRTAFFPEGGGQGADTGTLGPARVRDVQERDEHILHYTDRPLTVGECYSGRLDAEQRHRRNHRSENSRQKTPDERHCEYAVREYPVESQRF